MLNRLAVALLPSPVLLAPETGAGPGHAHAHTADRERERALLVRAQAGDQEAFGDLVRSHERKALSTAWRMLGNREDALDATQDALVRLYRHLHRVDDAREFGAWVYRIVVNTCLDLMKKRPRVDAIPQEVDWVHAGGTTGSAEDHLDTRRESTAVLRAIEQLPPKERAAIVLRDLEGLPTPEVARILQSSEATVRSQIASARTKLRDLRRRMQAGDGTNQTGNA